MCVKHAALAGLLTSVVAAAALVSGAAAADPIADFYKGKQINWILSAGAGGGYASYAHAFAPYLSAHIPGKPNIIVQNMPGAGGIRAMVYLSTVAPKDGTTMGLVHSSVPFAPLYGIKGANFDPRQMHWVGSINAATGICVSWTASGVTTWQDLFDKQFIVGGTGAGSQMETMPAMINKLFGTKIKIVSGYKGGNDVYIAMERGEVHGRCGGLKSSIKSTRPEWFPQKKVSVPIQIALERDPEFADTPALVEFAKDERTKQILELILSPMSMDRPILLPPGTAPDKVAALRKAFHDAMNDPGLIADAKKMNIEVEEISGEKIAGILSRAYSMPPDVIKAANEAMSLTGAGSD
jgi:tripartite-type tricarboxylate transporter receptor subunit TctC